MNIAALLGFLATGLSGMVLFAHGREWGDTDGGRG